ncbi:MAG: MFS transporter [Microbacterium sp.]|jgi:MFS family permease|uniref:MFS transporter n=1 Tax=Microbacterium sp. TaxID=51671 RepID=UPI0028325373|nr:MFS transporter [Microbacterium sp.]MDR2323562.1 MFS transporter [Microbacterium sp.]
MTASIPLVDLDDRPVVRRGILPALLCAVLAYSLMQTLLVPALPQLAASLRLDAAGSGWILTAYLLSGAVAAPVLGALGDRHGHRRVLLVSLTTFILGGILCALGGGFAVFLLGRVLQGAATAAFPLALAIVRRHLPVERQPAAIGWLSGALGLGAGIALVIGGVIAEVSSWQWLFAVGALLGAVALVLVAVLVPRRSVRAGSGSRIDVAGTALLSAGLLALLLAVAQGAAWGPLVTAALLVLAAALLAALWGVERRIREPLIDVRVLARPAMVLVNLLTLMLGFIPYAFYVGLPALFQAPPGTGFGMSVAATGLAMLPGAVLVVVGGRLAPALLSRMPAAVVAVIALGVMAGGSVGSALMAGSFPAIVVFFSLVGLGNGLGFALTADLVSRMVPRDEIAAAVGVNGVLRTIGSALGAPVTMLVIGGAHTASSFVVLFAVAAGVSVLGALVGGAIRIPRPGTIPG